MAPTIKWQRWDSASYEWHSTDSNDAASQIESEVDAFIAAVNANASNTGRQLTKERGVADSTSPSTHIGLTLKIGANGNADHAYFHSGAWNGSSALRSLYLGTTFDNGTANGGYGNITNGPKDTNVSFYPTGREANFLLTFDTTDGQEFFAVGVTFDSQSTSYEDGWVLFKDTRGEWVIVGNDSSTQYAMSYFDDSISTGWSAIDRTVSNTSAALVTSAETYGPFGIHGSNPSSSITENAILYAANPAMLAPRGSATYIYTGNRQVLTDVSAGGEYYLLSSYYYGPTLIVDLRP